MTEPTRSASSSLLAGEDWLDPLEERVRQSIRGFIEHLVESELDAFLGRQRYGRGGHVAGHRNGHREKQSKHPETQTPAGRGARTGESRPRGHED